MKSASDFISQHLGGSQRNTLDILESAKGKVLLIDEAYNLHGNKYGEEVLDVIVEKIQGNETDDIAVILIGYEKQMMEMMRNSNAGLARRFPLEYALYFDDYEPFELMRIYQQACVEKDVESPSDVTEDVMRLLTKKRQMSNFGNAGAVEMLLRNALIKASTRLFGTSYKKIVLQIDDFKSSKDEVLGISLESEDPLDLLDSLYRIDEIKHQLERMSNKFYVARKQGDKQPETGHFIFRGSPGTGAYK